MTVAKLRQRIWTRQPIPQNVPHMNISRFIFREIAHRKLNFLLGVLSVVIAVSSLIASRTLLQADQIRTSIAGKQLQDSMRKITKGLGFNILILPEDQDLNELHLEGIPSKTMPEDYVDKLAQSKIVTVNHLLPQVADKVDWPQYGGQIILIGTRGEVPLMHRAPKKPLQQQVPPGSIVLGYQLHKKLKLTKGDRVQLPDPHSQGDKPENREFQIIEVYDERGTADDITAWINLTEAQEMLGRENLVNAILALECNCATPDRVAEIRKELENFLPGTQVLERGPPALARAEARNKAEEVAAKTRDQHESLAAVLVPVIVVASGIWIGCLTLLNVRHRTSEIGILRAIGLRSGQVMAIFLGKALLIGVVGAVLGYCAGWWIGIRLATISGAVATFSELFDPLSLLIAVLAAPLLTVVASWIPALLAVQQDPAIVLQEA